MIEEKYVQVLLESVKDNSQLVCFIQYKLRNAELVEDKEKEIWRIKEVYMSSVRNESDAKERSADYRRHRNATDI